MTFLSAAKTEEESSRRVEYRKGTVKRLSTSYL